MKKAASRGGLVRLMLQFCGIAGTVVARSAAAPAGVEIDDGDFALERPLIG